MCRVKFVEHFNFKDDSAHKLVWSLEYRNKQKMCIIFFVLNKQPKKKKRWAELLCQGLDFSLKYQNTSITFRASIFYLFTWGKWTQKTSQCKSVSGHSPDETFLWINQSLYLRGWCNKEFSICHNFQCLSSQSVKHGSSAKYESSICSFQ